MIDLDLVAQHRPHVESMTPSEQDALFAQVFGRDRTPVSITSDPTVDELRLTPSEPQPVLLHRGRFVLTLAAGTLVVVGAVGASWAAGRNDPTPSPRSSQPASSSPASVDSPQTAGPATFPRLDFADSDLQPGLMLVGAQDYPVGGGWFSFANYGQDVDLESNGDSTRGPQLLVATFTGRQDDVDQLICISPTDVVQGDRAITVSECSPGRLRFVWTEVPGVIVVIDTNLSAGPALDAIETLQPVDEDVWQQRLDDVLASAVVRNSAGDGTVWKSYANALNTDDVAVALPTTSPG